MFFFRGVFSAGRRLAGIHFVAWILALARMTAVLSFPGVTLDPVRQSMTITYPDSTNRKSRMPARPPHRTASDPAGTRGAVMTALALWFTHREGT